MTTTVMTTAFVLGIALAAAPAPAADLGPAIEQVAAHAARVSADAREIRQLLRGGRPDFALVRERVATLEAQAGSLRDAIAAVDAARADLTSTQVAALDRARRASDTLLVLLANKAPMLQDAETVKKNRRLLRAKAEGIAKRADIVRQQIGQVRA
ncbi:MAG: hypothetical protein AB7Q16_05770 [Vicinamibacterales bacterium]